MSEFILEKFTLEPRSAYFSMEIAIASEIPTYAGGLGILAGDTLRSATDLNVPMVAVSLVCRRGYFKQEINDEGQQLEHSELWEPAKWATPLNAKVAITIEDRTVWVCGWLYIMKGHMTGHQPVILLDTDLDENNDIDRQITHYLYGGDEQYRLKQEIVLGIGGMLMLQALGFNIRRFHMNEGHSALLVLELLHRYAYPEEDIRPGELPYDIPRVRELCCFTTHTPIEAGHDRFPYDMVHRILGDFIELATLKHLAGEDSLNMTRLALNMSEYVNGVTQRHAEISRKMYPGYHVHAITNGVHPFTWTADSFIKLYDKHLPGWCHEPDLLVRTEHYISDDELWRAHSQAKTQLISRVKKLCDITLDPDIPILGFARRMTAYKRPDLLFTDIEKLKAIAAKYPFQIVLAGKAHPEDWEGKQLIKLLHEHISDLAGVITMVFLPDYDMELASRLVSGSDVWLNTPLPPLEASGTSGMKAAFNGVPNMSVLDGWWIEGCIEGVTGWAIGDGSGSVGADDARSLYEKLEQLVLPLYYHDRTGWINLMKGAICMNASFYNSHRMMRRYATEAYTR